MNTFRAIALASVIAVGVGGCVQGHQGPKQTGGTLIGAGLGALAGSQIGQGRGQLAAVAIGALAGAAIGGEVGRSLDRADRLHLANATSTARTAPLGSEIAWSNPESGNYGSVTPFREGYQRKSGARCREFHNSLTVRGETQQFVGVACQGADGSWTVK